MSNKTLTKAGWLWQDYTGAKWQNLKWANTGDDHASYVYPQGKSSKSSYRPKSLFYHYQVTGIDANKYKIDSVNFVLVIGKFNTKSNNLPSIKVFTGDNNAPYKTNPIKTVTSYTHLKNKYDFDSHTLQFTIKGLTIAQLKNLIIEVDWDRTLISGASTISVNRARLSVDYSLQNPKWTIYDSVNTTSTTVDKTIAWKITAKNSGYCGSGSVKLSLPKGVTVNSSSGNGSYNSSTKVWSFSGICKGKSVTRTFYIKSGSVGSKTLTALNQSTYKSNDSLTRKVSFTQKEVPVNPTPSITPRDDIITYTFYDTFSKEEGQYFDVNIQGMKENHTGESTVCYTLQTSANVELEEPVKTHAELLDENYNIASIKRDNEGDTTLCLNLDEANEDYIANVRIYIYCTDDTEGSITFTNSGNSYTETFDILPARKNEFYTEYVPSRDKQFVQNSINVGVPNVWTIRAKSHNHNFSDEKKSDFIIAIEKLIAYIGCIPIKRPHKEMEKANTTNTKIDNTYLNRRYLGKEGDTREEIPMTLRMKWQDVATLQGLVALDKPIPIDLIPELPDGDPVNHRGWAELTAVKNIWKVNDLVYECQPEVDYLTHALLTKFAIQAKDNLTTNKLDYFLSETMTYNGNLLDKFNVSYSQFWTNLEDEQGNITGTYEIEPSTDLYLNSIDVLKDYSNYNIKYRNELPALMSEDYDKNWEMAIRVLDKNTRQILFEHKYNNFKHYDFNENRVLNQADVTTKLLQGTNYNVLNYDNIVLGYDSLAPILEDNKNITHFNTLEDTTFDENNPSFELFLLDKNNIGLANQKVELRISDDEEYIERFDLITDIFGRFKFNVKLPNGAYNLECTYYETAANRGCTYSTDFTVAYTYTDTEFKYYEDFVTYVNDSYYEVTLVDSSDNPLNNQLVYYSFRDLANENYSHEESVLTDSTGKALIPVIYNNGSKELKVTFKGDGSYNPCFFETIVDINIQGKTTIMESDDVELTQGDHNRIYNIILKDENNVVLKDKPISICFYRQDESYVINTTTNDYGVATVPIYLNKGAWKVDSVFKGDDTYKPIINTNDILIREYVQLGTQLLSENIIIDESEVMAGNQDYYTLTLLDEENNPVPEEPINILVYNNDKSEKYVDVILKTGKDGVLEVPYLSHGETVLIESKYYGCNKYKPTNKSERVSFEENVIKEDVLFHIVEDTSDPSDIYREIFLKEGENDGHVLYEVFDGQYDIILNYPSNNRISNKGANYLASLNEGTFNVTFVYYGTENYYPQMITLEYEHPSDTRYPLSGGMVDFTDYVALQGLDNTYDYEYTLEDNYDVGSLAHLTVKCDYDLPDTVVHVGVGYNYGSAPTTLAQLTSRSDYVLTIPAPKWYSPLGARRSYLDFDFIVPSNGKLMILAPQTDFTPAVPLELTLTKTASTKAGTTIIENGFGLNNETYQDIFISTYNANATTNTLLNEYFIARVVNTQTFEELYYYSYLLNNESIIELKFLLEKGNWTLNILTKETNNYQGAAYAKNATLNVETAFEDTTLDPLFTYTDWTDKGDLSIEDSLDNTNDKIEATSDVVDLLHSVLTDDLITSNNYTFSFDWTYRFNSDYGFNAFGLNIDSTSSNIDGIWVNPHNIYEYRDGTLINSVALTQQMIETKVRVTVERKGSYYIIYLDGKQMYLSKNAEHNTFGVYLIGQGLSVKYDNFLLKDSETIIDVINPPIPETENLNTTLFGSDVHLELKKNRLSLIDYGMLPDGELGAGKIILNDVPLQEADYELEIWINYNNSRFERLNNLNGLIKMNIFEDISASDTALKYASIQCSPVPVPNSITRFTRLCDEGTMYYIETPKDNTARYLCNPYIQYKGGTNLLSETGVGLFDLDNAYSPVMLSNGLVRAEFHRRSGYIVVSRFDEATENWYKCNIFKLSNEPNLSLDEDYSDDKATVRFGDTKWTMWRGRPFIKLEHSNDNLRILNLVDRVYCETLENEFSMGFVEEHNTYMSIFNPRMTIQEFPAELYIGQNIRLDNFELVTLNKDNVEDEENPVPDNCLTLIDGSSSTDDSSTCSGKMMGDEVPADMDTEIVNNETAIKVDMGTEIRRGLVFPSTTSYVRKPGSTFSLLIGYFLQHGIVGLEVKARGFDDNGKIKVVEELQYGIWEDTQYVPLGEEGTPQEIRVTFTDVPDNVKYVDFTLVIIGNGGEAILNQIMLYEGDSTVKHEVDTSKANAALVEINFDETYYACLYDDDAPCGLCIVRPDKKKFTLRSLEASDETVIIPYMKKYAEHDAVENIMLEYFNSKNQILDVDWEG